MAQRFRSTSKPVGGERGLGACVTWHSFITKKGPAKVSAFQTFLGAYPWHTPLTRLSASEARLSPPMWRAWLRMASESLTHVLWETYNAIPILRNGGKAPRFASFL